MLQPIKIALNGMAYGLATQVISADEYQALVDSDTGLMFESCTLEEAESTYLYGKPLSPAPMYEAITTTKARVERTMKAFHRELARQFASTDITPSDAEISNPRVSGGFATLTARFPLSDGQSIGIIFHSPSGDPAKIAESDVLVAFRFVLNKRDVTPTVAPAGGSDVSLKQVTLKLSNLAERNSAKFQSKQGENSAKASELETLQTEVEAKQAELSDIIAQADKAEQEAADSLKENDVYSGVVSKAEARVKALKAKLAAMSKTKPPAENNEGDTVAIAPEPAISLSQLDQLELDNFIKYIDKEVKTYQAILGGDPRWAGFDSQAIPMSFNNKVKTLHKNGKTAVVDGILAHIAQINPSLIKPLYTSRHSIWKLGTVKQDIQEPTKKPEQPSKPKQEGATNEVLSFTHYAKLSGDIKDVPVGAVDSIPQNQLWANKELSAAVTATGIESFVGVVTYTQKLTDADRAKFDLVEILQPTVVEATEGKNGIADFKVEVSNLISTHFGKTWHEIGLTDPSALPSIIGGDSRFTTAERSELLKVANQYIVDKKIEDGQSIFGKSELYWYGLRARPFMMGAAPRAQQVVVLTNDEAMAKFPTLGANNAIRHGAIAYANPLSDEDIKSFEFVDLAKQMKIADGAELSPEDFDYLMTDLMSSLLDTYGDTSTTFTRSVAASLVESFSLSRNWLLKAIKGTLTFQERKDDVERYKQQTTLRETLTVKQFEDALMAYVKDEPEPEPVPEPEPAPEPEPVPEPELVPAPVGEPEPVTTEGTQVIEGGDNDVGGDGSASIVQALEAALLNETDVEALIDLLDKSIDELTELSAYDDNEALIEKVSDRITELLTKEDAA